MPIGRGKSAQNPPLEIFLGKNTLPHPPRKIFRQKPLNESPLGKIFGPKFP